MLKQKEVKLTVDTSDTLKDASLEKISEYCTKTSIYKNGYSIKFTMFKEQWDRQNKDRIHHSNSIDRSTRMYDEDFDRIIPKG